MFLSVQLKEDVVLLNVAASLTLGSNPSESNKLQVRHVVEYLCNLSVSWKKIVYTGSKDSFTNLSVGKQCATVICFPFRSKKTVYGPPKPTSMIRIA